MRRRMQPRDRLVLALDVPDLHTAESWLDRLGDEVGVFKVGLELFSAAGPDAVRAVHARGGACFLDLKLHDIPATMGKAAAAAAHLGVRYLTVHAAAGPQAIAETRRAVEGTDLELLAVTVLTSLDDDELAQIGFKGAAADTVVHLGTLAIDAGAHGLVCSAQECAALRAQLGAEPVLMVPGIRPLGSPTADQRRVATPSAAIRDGADLLVLGRPIRNAADPLAATRAIVTEVAEAQP